ncbi:MAG: YaeQ family protein [Desulfuromusa sp.]|nr:YaeQ family protein [Desulfuromusa sp.]
MATKATIIRAELEIADMNRNYYQTHQLTLAQHPSETHERVMMRLVAFALHANEERLSFTRGISTDTEPDLWQKDLSDQIGLWIELDQIDEKRIKRACGVADQVVIYTCQPRNALPWWKQMEARLKRFGNLTVAAIDVISDCRIEALLNRSMQLQCTVQDNTVHLSNSSQSVELRSRSLM